MNEWLIVVNTNYDDRVAWMIALSTGRRCAVCDELLFLPLKWAAGILATCHNNNNNNMPAFGLDQPANLDTSIQAYLFNTCALLSINISSKPRRVMSCHDSELQ